MEPPEVVEETMVGDCVEHAFYLDDRLQRRGVESKVIFGIYTKDPHDRDLKGEWWGHAWVKANVEGIWYLLDAADKSRPIFYVGVINTDHYIERPMFLWEDKLREYSKRRNTVKKLMKRPDIGSAVEAAKIYDELKRITSFPNVAIEN